MQFPREAQIERAASKIPGVVLSQPWLDAENQKLVAANGYILAIVPVTCDSNDVTGAVPVDALRYTRKRTPKGEIPEITAGTTELVFADMRMDRPLTSEFPDYREMLDQAEWRPGQHYRLALNAAILWDLARALGAADGEVILDFAIDPRAPIYVRPLDSSNGAEGALMPELAADDRVGPRTVGMMEGAAPGSDA